MINLAIFIVLFSSSIVIVGQLSDIIIRQNRILAELISINRELSYNRIAQRRLTDINIKNDDLLAVLNIIKDDVVNLKYYVGAVYHDELKEFAKKKEKGL